jgi:hypothetical protein
LNAHQACGFVGFEHGVASRSHRVQHRRQAEVELAQVDQRGDAIEAGQHQNRITEALGSARAAEPCPHGKETSHRAERVSHLSDVPGHGPQVQQHGSAVGHRAAIDREHLHLPGQDSRQKDRGQAAPKRQEGKPEAGTRHAPEHVPSPSLEPDADHQERQEHDRGRDRRPAERGQRDRGSPPEQTAQHQAMQQ